MGMVFCRGCGKEIHDSATICPHCGAPQKTKEQIKSSLKGQTLTAVLAAFLGALGVHRFYLGKIVTGVLYFLFCWTGIPFLISAVETYLIAFMPVEKWAKKYNNGEIGTPVPAILKFLLLLPAILIAMAFIGGVLVAIALPAYQDYTKRAEVSELLLVTSSCRTAVAEAIASNTLPTKRYNGFGCESFDKDGTSKNVKGVATYFDGRYIEIVGYGKGNLDGIFVVLNPTIAVNNSISWKCATSHPRVAPSSCKEQATQVQTTLPTKDEKIEETVISPVRQSDGSPAQANTTEPQPSPAATQESATSGTETVTRPVKDSLVSSNFNVKGKPIIAASLTTMLRESTNSIKLAELKGAIEDQPKPQTGDRKAARALNEKGLAALRAEKYADAINFLQQSVAEDESDVEIRNNFAFALIKAKKYDEAEGEVGTVLSYSAGRSSAWANLAEIYAAKGFVNEAAAALIVAFQFSSNKDKTLTFLKEKSSNSDDVRFQEASKIALQRLSN